MSAYKGGGKVKTLYLPESAEEFKTLLENGTDKILGGGSNTLIPDGIIEEAISTSRLSGVKADGNYVFVDAGASVHSVLKLCAENGLGGLEFLSGVPASIGGALKMNAGAFLHEIKDYVCKIDVLTSDFAVKTIDANDVNWGYRRGVDGVVLSAVLRFDSLDRELIEENKRAYMAKRRERQPSAPSLGSVFKRADKAAGIYLDCAGLKGERHGGAEISRVHANFIVNVGGGSADDYLFLVSLAEKRVFELYGVMLEREFVVLGEGRHSTS